MGEIINEIWAWIRIPVVFIPWLYMLTVFFRWADKVYPFEMFAKREDTPFPYKKMLVAFVIGVSILAFCFALKALKGE